MMPRLAVLLLGASAALYGADAGFDRLVRAVETHYGIHRTHIPLMGVANFVLKVAHPAGAHGFKLAIFGDMHSCERCFDREELDGFISDTADDSLHLLVRVRTRHDATYLLTGDIGKTTRMLVAVFADSEATIVEVTVDLKTLLRTIHAPETVRDWVDEAGSDSQRSRFEP